MELHIDVETVEPSLIRTNTPSVAAFSAQTPFLKRLETIRLGRALLSCMRWGIVCGLVLSGYFGAEMINAGIELASRQQDGLVNSQPLLASASAPR
jgi:hypothetical protein